MKAILVLALFLLLCVTSGAAVNCELPAFPLLNQHAYACDDADQQPVWYVVYENKEIIVIAVQPVKAEIASQIPAMLRPKSMNFYSAGNTLHLWLTKGLTGPQIRMEGTN
jgi:hypothetical protein